MFKTAILASFVISGATAKLAAAVQDPSDIESVRRATVTIQVTTTTGGSVRGIGFLLSSDGIIATAAHVIERAASGTVRLMTGEEYPLAGVLTVDEERGFALVRIAGFDLPTVTLGNSNSVAIGQPVVAFDAPQLTRADGSLTADGLMGGTRVLQLSRPVSLGSSGGPLAADEGSVVGILVAGLIGGGASNVDFALPINYVRGALAIAVSQPPVPLAQWEWQGADRPSPTVSEPPPPVSEPPPPVSEPPPTISETRSDGVNDSLDLFWNSLDGAGTYLETRLDNGMQSRLAVEFNVLLGPAGTLTLERSASQVVGRADAVSWRGEYRTVVELAGDHRVTTFAEVASLDRDVEPFSSALRIDGSQFWFDSSGTWHTAEIPHGVYPAELLNAIIAATFGPLPEVMTVWLVGTDGKPEAVRVEFGGRVRVRVPVPRLGTSCNEDTITQIAVTNAVRASYIIGGNRFEQRYLILEPHLTVDENLKCMVIPGIQ